MPSIHENDDGRNVPTMVERVARAIAERDLWRGAFDAHLIDAQRESYRQAARAAIEAMREPTEGMILSAWHETNDHSICQDTNLFLLTAYTSAINAALDGAD